MAASRKTSRELLASLLTTGVTAAQAVYAYQVGDFGQLSPVLRVLSLGAARPSLTAEGNQSVFLLEVQVFVVNVDPDSGWTEQNAEDKLDEVEQQIADVIEDNDSNNGTWNALEHAERSAVTKAVVGGETYLMESIPVAVTVFG
jgi:hypothetical protein